jgi:hypothetical protein
MKKGTLLESLETVLVVTVIAALIWLYAEGETVITQTRRVNVRFVAPTTGMAVSLTDQESSVVGGAVLDVQAALQASQGDLPRIAEWVRNETVDIEVRVPSSTDEVQVINLQDVLNQSPLADLNAFIKETSPETVSVRVQQLRTVEMPIRIEKGDLELSDEAPPLIVPDKVAVTMPANLAQLVSDQSIQLVARLDLLDRETLEQDTLNVETVELNLPTELLNQSHVNLSRPRVEARFLVRRNTAEFTLERVQVRLRITDDITGLYRIQIDPSSQRILRVKVRGPNEAVKRIENDPSLVRASILIKMEDLTNSANNHTAPLDIFLPEGVKIVSVEPNLTTVTYTAEALNPQP